MLNRNDIERLRAIDSSKAVYSISVACRGGYTNIEPSVYAASYVLMRSLEDYQISVDSLDYYLQTANEKETREMFIRQSLEKCWDNIRALKYQYSADEFKAVLLFYNGNGNRGWNTSTPDSVCRLAAKIINPKPDMTILDIGTGTGNFLRESVAEEPEAKYCGLDISTEMAVIAGIRAELLGGQIEIRQGNLFDDESLNRSFDAVFANYPIGMRISNVGSYGSEYIKSLSIKSQEYSKLSGADWIFNRRAYECVAGPGRAVCIMANGSTWNTLDKGARRRFVEDGSVNMVISLPPRIYDNSNVGFTMIVFSHGNLKTMMVDASNICEKGRRQNLLTDANIQQILDACNTETAGISRYVSAEVIIGQQYNLNPAAYLASPSSVIDNGVELGEVVSITRGAQLLAKELDEMASDTVSDTQYLMLANIQDGIIDDELPYIKELDEKLEKYCLKNNDLLISKIGTPFKIAVAEVKSGHKVLANGNLYVLTVDETRADPYYIKAYLESEQGAAALKRITVGSTIPNLGVEQLKKMIIPLPPVDTQRKIANEYKACIDELRLLRRRKTKVLDRMSHVFSMGEEG